MKSVNMKKLATINILAVVLVPMVVVFQNFSESPKAISETTQKESTIEDSLAAALKNAEVDHTAKQVALQVEPNQVETRIKKTRSPSNIVELKSDNSIDTDESARAVVSPMQEEELDVENAMPAGD